MKRVRNVGSNIHLTTGSGLRVSIKCAALGLSHYSDLGRVKIYV